MAAPAGLLVLGRRPARLLQLLRRLRPVRQRLHAEARLERLRQVRRRHRRLSRRRPSRRKIGGLATEAKTSAESDPLAPFSAPVRRWFEASFEGPTPAQAGGWEAISERRQRPDLRPDRLRQDAGQLPLGHRQALAARPSAAPGVRLVYVSPLKALSYDIERNLRAPLRGSAPTSRSACAPATPPQSERRAMRKTPPDILITTPESLYLMLSSGVREILTTVEAVIVDEIHAVAQSKRGSHLALTLERPRSDGSEQRGEAPTPPSPSSGSASPRPSARWSG